MALRITTALRTTRATDIAAAAAANGAGCKLKFYNGTVPATGGTPAGTLLATLVFGATLGTVSSGVLTFGSVTQANSSHVSGTPTFARVTTATDVFVADVDVGTEAGNMTFSSPVITGTDINLGVTTITEGNA